MKPLTKQVLKKFLRLAPQTLQGEWILLGGALLPALGVETRATTDIDLVPLGEGTSSASATLALMDLALSLDLPVEAVNSAAGFFLSKIKDHRKDLVLIDESKKWRLYRPNFSLYLRLKAARLSESDLADVETYAGIFPEEARAAHKELVSFVRKLLRGEKSAGKAQRLASLEKLLAAFSPRNGQTKKTKARLG